MGKLELSWLFLVYLYAHNLHSSLPYYRRQMLLQKRVSSCVTTDDNDYEEQVMISDKDLRLVKKFEELATYHKRKINSGWVRQVPNRHLQ